LLVVSEAEIQQEIGMAAFLRGKGSTRIFRIAAGLRCIWGSQRRRPLSAAVRRSFCNLRMLSCPDLPRPERWNSEMLKPPDEAVEPTPPIKPPDDAVDPKQAFLLVTFIHGIHHLAGSAALAQRNRRGA